MVTNSVSIIIERPIEEVFAFLTDARNNPLWQAKAGLKATRQEPEEPVGVGTRITETWQCMGRKTEATREVTEYELNHKCTQRHLWGASLIKEGRLLFEPVGDQTRCTYTALVQAGGIFALAEPILASVFKKAMATSLAEAKHVLETPR
jgi:uncharacterized protein YndB with AHSA1/START domain